MVTGSREAAAGRQWRQHAEASAQGESSASVLPCRVCGRVWRKRRRFAFWRNRPTWRRRRALAIGRAHSLYSHPGWLETAHQTAHMCFSVITSTMTPSRRRAQDCPRPPSGARGAGVRPTCRHRRFHRPNRGIQMGPHSSSSAPCLRMVGASAARAELWQERGASSHAHVLNRPLQQLMRRGLPFRCPAPLLLQLKIA